MTSLDRVSVARGLDRLLEMMDGRAALPSEAFGEAWRRFDPDAGRERWSAAIRGVVARKAHRVAEPA